MAILDTLSWRPMVVSLVATPIALVLGLFSAGAGHGNYVLAKLLFPYTMLSTGYYGSISNFFFGVAVLQFPIYGLILSFGETTRRFGLVAGLLVIAHALAAVLSFLYADSSFSG